MSIGSVAARQAAKHEPDPQAEKVRTITKTKPPRNQRWSFSFRYFSEIKNFGLDSGQVDKKWTLSVIYRLQELSKLTISEVTESRDIVEGSMRIHDINWNAKNVPLKRSDLDWIDKDYLGNPEEFPIMQIAVSKAEGRLVGFFDEQNAFQIVLLDPLHNAQPSKYNGYKVRLCKPLGCELSTVMHEAKKAVEKIANRECNCSADLEGALDWTNRKFGSALVIPSPDDGIVKEADTLIELELAEGYEQIVRAGIEVLLNPPAPPAGGAESEEPR